MTENLVSIADLSAGDITHLVDRATELKQDPIDVTSPLLNRSAALIFDKPSLRTRLSFAVGMRQLGGGSDYLTPADIGLGKRETIHDTAVVVSSMSDLIVARVSSHDAIVELAEHSTVPVINAMTDREHPCQVLADLLTINERFGKLTGVKLAYVGDANNNVTNSLALAAETMGMPLSIAAPEGYELSDEFRRLAPSTRHFTNPAEAVEGVDVVITDTWVSMGKEAEEADRLRDLEPYRVDAALMARAGRSAVFMHCLPAYRGKEVAAEVIDGPQSLVFDEAENRLHAQKALMLELLGK